ncbi:MAG: cysteine desulfurase [Deltaproteobacteria bacterium]|nr:cysteine desulfurase [Deltaproteobacteria bacterium]
MIYLDYNATTPIASEVVDAMLPFLRGHFANPSSSYALADEPREAVVHARQQVAALIGASAEEVVFTSGGTESNNQALRGAARARRQQDGRKRLITSAVEHPAVMEVCRALSAEGFDWVVLPVDAEGRVHPAFLRRVIDEDTALVSVMHANNEVGTIQPIAEFAAIAHEAGAWMHTDAAQSVGKISTDVSDLGVDLLSIASHKIYGPKGVGALYMRRGLELPNFMLGAGQENGRRAGTENVLGIVGLGAACAHVGCELEAHGVQLQALRDSLHERLKDALGPEVRLNGPMEGRLPTTLSVGFAGVRAHALLAALEGEVMASAGAACKSGNEGISTVLKAMGVPESWALGTLRLSVGEGTTEEDVALAAEQIVAAFHGARS